MAYAETGFTTIAASKAGSSPSMYAYKSTDALADVNTSGYFNSLSTLLSVGDVIYCVTSTGTTAVASFVYVVSNASGVVDVTDGTVLANTDGD
jgi:hypothetical protein